MPLRATARFVGLVLGDPLLTLQVVFVYLVGLIGNERAGGVRQSGNPHMGGPAWHAGGAAGHRPHRVPPGVLPPRRGVAQTWGLPWLSVGTALPSQQAQRRPTCAPNLGMHQCHRWYTRTGRACAQPASTLPACLARRRPTWRYRPSVRWCAQRLTGPACIGPSRQRRYVSTAAPNWQHSQR